MYYSTGVFTRFFSSVIRLLLIQVGVKLILW